MNDNQRNILENIEKNGLLPAQKSNFGQNVVINNATTPNLQPTINTNIFSSQGSKPMFGALTVQPKQAEIRRNATIKKTAIDGFDSDILANSKYKN